MCLYCTLVSDLLCLSHAVVLCGTCQHLTVALLLQGLAKLQKTQKDVDILVEEAKIKAVEVEKKVAGADAFAEQARTSLQCICIPDKS